MRSFRASYQQRISDDSIDQIVRAVTTFSNDFFFPLRGHEFLEHEGKKFWQKALEPSKRANAIVQLFRRVIAVVSREQFVRGGEHREQASNEEKERDPAGRREREKKERGPRGVEFGWNSSGGGTGGRGPFVVMATAGFHRLIDPPRSRSSTKPQSSPRSHHCLSHHFRNDGAVTTDTPLRTFSTGFVSIASICVNDRPFSFLARLVRERSRDPSRSRENFTISRSRNFVVAWFSRRSQVNRSVGRRERRANVGKQPASNNGRGCNAIFKYFLCDVRSYA